MPESNKMKPADMNRLASLLCQQRWACLGSVNQGRPYVSWVAYAIDDHASGLLLHLSRLARHTKNLLDDPAVSLAISEADDGQSDPQCLARVTLEGVVEIVARDHPGYQTARQQYLSRLPDSEMLFGFEDFYLFRLLPQSIHYVEGFGSSHRFNLEQLQKVLQNNNKSV